MTFDPNQPVTPEAPPVPAAVPTAPVAPAPVTTTKPKSSSGGRIVNLVLGVAIVIAIGGVAFAIGRTTAPASAATTGRGGFGALPGASGAPAFIGGRGALGGGGLTIRGTVESVDGDTVTIKTANGQTIEVTTGADTTYTTATPGSASDVTDGASVQVQVEFAGGAGAGGLRPGASGAPTGPVGTAGSITVLP